MNLFSTLVDKLSLLMNMFSTSVNYVQYIDEYIESAINQYFQPGDE